MMKFYKYYVFKILILMFIVAVTTESIFEVGGIG